MDKNKQVNKDSIRKGLIKTIILSGLLVGIFDGAAAIIQYTLMGADNPIRVFNFVASGVFGEAALTGGSIMTLLGILFHLIIATIWTTIYFLIYPTVQRLSHQWFVTGTFYGVIVWTCMNIIVLPISNTPPHTFTVSGVIVGMLIIILCVGLPVAYFSNEFFRERKEA